LVLVSINKLHDTFGHKELKEHINLLFPSKLIISIIKTYDILKDSTVVLQTDMIRI